MSLLLEGLMRGIKIPQQDFAPKMQGGGLCARGVYLQDTTVEIPLGNLVCAFLFTKIIDWVYSFDDLGGGG